MADRIYPKDSPPANESSSEYPIPPNQKQTKTAGTYVVQIPKDQIYRHPPPENARRYQDYSRRKNRRNPCCCCLCWIIGILILLILLFAISAGVFYFVFQPKSPNYTVNNLSIKGIKLSKSSISSSSTTDLTLSPEIDVTVRAQNPNKRIGIYYEKGSYVAVSHSTITLCSGTLPDFYQPTGNVTVFQTALKGSGVKLTALDNNALIDEQNKGEIPLGLDLKVPIRIKVGSVKTWKFTVKVHCDLKVDKLSPDSKIVSKKCGFGLKLWKD